MDTYWLAVGEDMLADLLDSWYAESVGCDWLEVFVVGLFQVGVDSSGIDQRLHLMVNRLMTMLNIQIQAGGT